MNAAKIVGVSLVAIVILIAILFGTTNLSLWWKGHFNPKFKNVERKVFEETKSYVHGAIQDIGNYYGQYQQAETEEEKASIQSVVKVRFSEFNAENISSLELRNFLIKARGY